MPSTHFSKMIGKCVRTSRSISACAGTTSVFPTITSGLMGTAVGGPKAVNGLTGTAFNGTLAKIDFIGKNSTHPDPTLWDNDYNNFAPAVGLSWNVPYFGKNKTVLRAGYGVTYQGGGRTFSNLDGAVGSVQGL